MGRPVGQPRQAFFPVTPQPGMHRFRASPPALGDLNDRNTAGKDLSVCGVVERRLRLKVNREKSSIRHAADATLLGSGSTSTARRS